MKVKFTVRFKNGDVNWFNKDHWQTFSQDDVLRCLIDFTEVKEFFCNFDSKERMWIAKVTIPPMTASNFIDKFEEVLERIYKRRDGAVNVSEVKLEKGEIGKWTTAYTMKKIEGK